MLSAIYFNNDTVIKANKINYVIAMGCCLLNFNPSICFILKCLQSSCSASVGLFLRALPNVFILFTLETPPP